MSHDPVVRSAALDAQLDDNPMIANLVRVANQHGKLIKGLIVSIALDIGLSIAVIVLGVGVNSTAQQAKHAADLATSAVTQERQLCAAGNVFRMQQRTLWNHLLVLTAANPPPGETAEQRQQRRRVTAEFRAYITKVFAVRDCKHLVPRPSPKPPTSALLLPTTPYPQPQQGAASPVPGTPQVVAPPNRASNPAASSPRSPRSASSSPPSVSRPSPSPTCDLTHPLRCLPGKESAAGAPPAGGNRGYPVVVAVVTVMLVATQLVRVSKPMFQGRVVRSGASADRRAQ